MTHGPQMHGAIVGVLAIVGIVFVLSRGVMSLVAKARARSRQATGPEYGPGPVATPATAPTIGVHQDGHSCGSRRMEATDGSPMGPVVSVRGLTKRYGDFVAVDDVTFSLRPCTVTGFLGPNGAGKTTTLRLMLGLAEPTAGEALVLGKRYADLEQPARRVGAVLESTDFHPRRSGRDHLRVLALAAGVTASRVDEVLDLVALAPAAAGRPVGTYSLGMRQRLGLAAALLGDPELLMLDEPANGLDPVGVRWLRTFLRGFADGGGAVLVSSHVLAEVAQNVDRVLIIDRGRLVADAPLDELAGRNQSLEDVYLALTEGALS